MEKVIDIQIGGNHYKKMPFQPVELFAKTHCTAFQANIWKYISRYKFKNGEEDVRKCMHYAKLAKEFECNGNLHYKKVFLADRFCIVNGIKGLAESIIQNAARDNYDDVIEDCELLLQKEYSVK